VKVGGVRIGFFYLYQPHDCDSREPGVADLDPVDQYLIGGADPYLFLSKIERNLRK
jgi:hypothetical protein